MINQNNLLIKDQAIESPKWEDPLIKDNKLEFKTQLNCSLVAWPWTSHLTILSLNSLNGYITNASRTNSTKYVNIRKCTQMHMGSHKAVTAQRLHMNRHVGFGKRNKNKTNKKGCKNIFEKTASLLAHS